MNPEWKYNLTTEALSPCPLPPPPPPSLPRPLCDGGGGRAPPAKLVLAGDVKNQPSCQGVYTLVAGREAHGWPVWEHESNDRWIARVATGNWMVQDKKNVGVTIEGCMLLVDRRQVLPHKCIGKWQEWDGRGWVQAPQVNCAADLPAAPAQQSPAAASSSSARSSQQREGCLRRMDQQPEYKRQAQNYVQELLHKVDQLDGPDKKAQVRQAIRDVGKELSKLSALVRELTNKYAPQLTQRWEEILRKTVEAHRRPAQANPAQSIQAGLGGAAAGKQVDGTSARPGSGVGGAAREGAGVDSGNATWDRTDAGVQTDDLPAAVEVSVMWSAADVSVQTDAVVGTDTVDGATDELLEDAFADLLNRLKRRRTSEGAAAKAARLLVERAEQRAIDAEAATAELEKRATDAEAALAELRNELEVTLEREQKRKRTLMACLGD